jgi:YD repeat-containing protein
MTPRANYFLATFAALGLAASATAVASPPSAPGALSAVGVSSTQTNLTWTASTDTGATITGYIIQRCQGSGCSTYTQVGSVSSGTSYYDAGLTAATVYQYQVYATDSNSTSSPVSNTAAATTMVASVSSAVTYGYDALGRLVQANVAALNIVENYTYDGAGNLLSVTPASASTLAVANLSSSQGSAGSTVTIFGSGFSTTPSSNTVQFNGISASVVSATSTQLVVSVPTGATNGPITVNTGTTTVSSPGSFTVTSNPGAPTITFAPTIAAPGSIIVVQGTGFQTTASNNKVQINQTWATVVSATATALQILVPNIVQSNPNLGDSQIGAGRISVTTPYGTATTANPLVITAGNYNLANVSTTTINGAPVVFSTTTASLNGMTTFDATQGANLTVTTSAVAPANAWSAVSLLAPNGQYLFGTTIVGNNTAQLPTLPMSGTYSLLVGGSLTNVALNVSGPAQGTLTLNGTPTSVTLSLPGQATNLTFGGTQNAYVTLTISAVTLSTSTITISNPDATTLMTLPLSTSGIKFSPQLPQTGTYTVSVVPKGAISGGFTAALASGPTSLLTPNQSPYSLPIANQTPISIPFNGAAGQYMSLGVTASSGTINTLGVSVLGPDGATVSTGQWQVCPTCPGSALSFGPLPENGSYTAIFHEISSPSTATLSISLATPLTGTGMLGTPSNVSTNILGQSVEQTFNASAGQYISAAFSSAWYITYGSISILGPDGVPLATQTFQGSCGGYPCNASGVVNAGPLPSTGTYTALIQQTPPSAAATGAVALTIDAAVQGTLTLGTPVTIPVANGQGLQQAFTGTTGQYASIALQTSSTGTTVTAGTISVLDPNGQILATAPFTGNCVPGCSGSGVVNVGPLALAGTYTLLFQQSKGQYMYGPAAGSITVTPTLPVAGALTDGSSSNVSVNAGQGFAETLSGTAGQYLSVDLTSHGTVAVTSGTVSILSPTGAVLMTAPFSAYCVPGPCSGAGNINLGPLPTTGSYTVEFQQTDGGGGPAAASVSVTPELAATGSLTLGTPVTSPLVNAQGIQQTFSGTAGQFDTVTVSESAGNIQGAKIYVIAPTGATIATNTFSPSCPTTCTGSVSFNIGPLTTGTYTLLVQQSAQAYGFGSGSLTVGVTNNTAGAAEVQNLSTTVAGQAAQFTFVAAASQAFNLTFTNMAFTPSSVTTYSIKITAPNGATAYTNSCTAATCPMMLGGITQSGTYTVTVTPGGSATMTGTANLMPTVTGTLAIGTPTNLTLGVWQGAAFTFNVSASQTLSLQIGSVVSSPANAYYTYSVQNPSGLTINSQYLPAGPTINLPNLAAGTYTLLISPGNPAASSSMQINLVAGISDPLPITGVDVNVTTSTPGEAAFFTYSGTSGQSMSLAITNLVLMPSTVTYANVSPGASSILMVGGGSCYPATGCEIHLPYLPQTGSYTASVTPAGAATMSFTATATPDFTATLAWGTPLTVNLSEMGQSAILTFDVAPGADQDPAIYFSNITTNPTTAQYTVTMYIVNQDFASQGGTNLVNGGSAIRNLTNMPPGTYAMIITPSKPATGSFQVTLGQSAAQMLPTNGTATNVSTSTPGQYAYMRFNATAGQNLSLAFSGCVFSPSTVTTANITVFKPDGTGGVGGGAYYSTTPGAAFSLPNLKETGTYTVEVSPGGSATMNCTATLSLDATGTLALNTPLSESLTVLGQSAMLSFNATAGLTLALEISSLVTTPSGNSVVATVYGPTGVSIASGSVTAGHTYTFNLPNLSAGAYSLLVSPTYATTQSFQANLIVGVTGALPTNGSGNNFATTMSGENAYLTFSGTAGQSLSLGITNLVTNPAGSYVTIYIYPPTGTSYSYYTSCTTPTPSFCALKLPVLPQTGTYTIQVIPSTQSTMNFTAALFQDITGTLVSTSATSVSLSTAGQNESLSFTALGGTAVTISAAAITTTPANTSVGFYVYNSTGALVGSGSGTTTATLNLGSLAAGTYSLIIAPSNGATATMQVTGTGIQ